MTILFISRFNEEYLIFKPWQGLEMLVGSISSFSRGKDSRGTKGGHWTERSEGSGWSDSGTPDSASLQCKLGTRNAMHFSLFLRSKKPPKEKKFKT